MTLLRTRLEASLDALAQADQLDQRARRARVDAVHIGLQADDHCFENVTGIGFRAV
jgi:diacylglycerol kinase family enzyme